MTSEHRDAVWGAYLDETAAPTSYPATPDLEHRVLAAVGRERRSERRTHGWAPRLAIAAALAVLFLSATIAIPSARTAVGEFFGLVEGERIEVLPDPSPGAAPTALPTAPAIEDLGTPFTLDELREAIGFRPELPGGRPPNATFLVDYEGARVAVLQYDDYDLWQSRTTGFGYFSKGVPPGTPIDTPAIGDEFGYWIEGGGYLVRFINSEGDEVIGSERAIDRNTLIWRGPSNTFYRLETSLSLDDALAIAESLP